MKLLIFICCFFWSADVVGQVLRIQCGSNSGSCSVVDGRLLTVTHVLHGGHWLSDRIEDLGPAPDNAVVLPSGDASVGGVVIEGFDCEGRRFSVPGEIVSVTGRVAAFRPRPRNGFSGGLLRQRGKAVAVIRSRRGPFGEALLIRSKVKSGLAPE